MKNATKHAQELKSLMRKLLRKQGFAHVFRSTLADLFEVGHPVQSQDIRKQRLDRHRTVGLFVPDEGLECLIGMSTAGVGIDGEVLRADAVVITPTPSG